MKFLTFRLYAPLSSWGQIAVGESRHSAAHPSRSGLLGLLGAALGLKREEKASQKSLAASCVFGVKLLSPGTLLKDYHTTQVPDDVGKYRYVTRHEELKLGSGPLGTILSSRDYRQDAQFIIAVKSNEGASVSLEDMHTALMFPKFHLYLGRKSCPPSLPLSPRITQADGFKNALDTHKLVPFMNGSFSKEDENRYLPIRQEQVRYFWEGVEEDFAEASSINGEAIQRNMRNDQPISRQKWQFCKRLEFTYQHVAGEEKENVFFKNQD